MGPGQYHSPIIITILAVLYAWTLSSVFVADELSPIPKNQQGLNITSAVNDLHRIAARPRPYNSHANDAARAYILTRVRDITRPHSSFVQVSNDLTSNATFLDDGGRGAYFEGANILVKIDGTDERYRKTGGVLFSAHFDSVSTAKGVSDDAMSVVACLQMIEFLVQNRPKRTAIFNINNGEEDGLYGAQIFIQHPWFAIVDTFLNMEGAAAGGRPIIFRTTSSNPLSSFRSLPYPHANVISSDGHSRGLIRGGTDFAVYIKGLDTNKTNERQGGKQGVDVAFYKHRSFYHTKYDDITHTEGGERALWSMMEVARHGGWAMLNKADDDDSSENDDAGVYFDLFGESLVLFTQRALLIVNIILLIVGPLSITALVFTKAIISRRVARAQRHIPSQNTSHESVWQSTKRWVKITVLDVSGARMKTRFWFAFVLNVLAQVVFVWMYLKINPNIMYSQPFTVFATTMLLAFIALTFPLFFHRSHHSTPYADRKQSILLQLYILTYVLSLGSTPLLAGVSGPGIGGVYFLTALHAGVWLGSLVGCVEGIINARHGAVDETVVEEVEEEAREEHHAPPRSSDERPREGSNGTVSRSGKLLVRGVRFEVSEEEGEATSVTPDGTRQGVIVETEPTEITPLIPPGDSADEPRRALDELSAAAGQRSDAMYLERKKSLLGRVIPWTAIQLALVVPVPVVLMLHVVVLLLNGIPETLADGGKAVIVYGSASIFSTLLVLPILPFVLPRFPKNAPRQARKSPPLTMSSLTFLALILLIGTTIYTMSAFPFSQDVPLKVFFQQKVEVDLSPGPITGPGPGLPIPPPKGPPTDPEPPSPSGEYSPLPLKVETTLMGLDPYIFQIVTKSFPSAWGTGILCFGSSKRSGLGKCTWDVIKDVGMLPSPIVRRPSDGLNTSMVAKNPTARGTRDWLRVRTRRLNDTRILIGVRGVNSRSCRIYADSGVIRRFRVLPGNGDTDFPEFEKFEQLGLDDETGWDMQPGYELPEEGIQLVKLWSRMWDREFVVELDWEAPKNKDEKFGLHTQHLPSLTPSLSLEDDDDEDDSQYFQGRVACEWSEYESGTIGESGRVSRGARIPAYEEVLANLPKWVVASKIDDGLVEVWGKVIL